MEKNQTEYTVEQLEAMLQQKKKAEAAEKQKERENYETDRDVSISLMVAMAVDTHEQLASFKELCNAKFNEHAEKLKEYGGIRASSKGGFSLVNKEGTLKAVRVRRTMPMWDERSEKAIELIKSFLLDTVKKKDQKHYTLISSFIEKNEKGDLEYSKVMEMMKHKDLYDDERWVKGLSLLQESYSTVQAKFGYEFYTKDEAAGGWKKIEINFTSL